MVPVRHLNAEAKQKKYIVVPALVSAWKLLLLHGFGYQCCLGARRVGHISLPAHWWLDIILEYISDRVYTEYI